MDLAEILEALHEQGPGGLERFASSLDPEWIEEALAATGKASIRRRKLPAEQAVWLVLGMALFADRSIRDVVDHLGLVIEGVDTLAPSNVTKARYRLGEAPLRMLFERVAERWGDTPGLGGYRGLALRGVDGTHVRVQDSDANFEHFGKPNGRSGQNDSGYPQLRLVALMDLSNRLLIDALAGPYHCGETTLAEPLWAKLVDRSLTLLDRGFFSYETFHAIASSGSERHVLVRARKDLRTEEVEVLSDGSVRADLVARHALRREHPHLPQSLPIRVIHYKHPGGEESRLFTSLLDHEAYPAQELIDLYHERWELEVGFDELKTHMLERKECLRSKKPEGVLQELWGQLLVYNLVRREMLLAAQAHKLPPKRISFRSSLMWIRNCWITAWMTSPGNLPKSLANLRSTLDVLILPERRSERRYPRHVKIKMSNYKRNRGKRDLGVEPQSTASQQIETSTESA